MKGLDREVIPPQDVTVDAYFPALYRSRCALNQEHHINPDDMIGHSEHGWICMSCLDIATGSSWSSAAVG